MKKKVVALCGKSASGKDTIVKELIKLDPEHFKSIISYTTRPSRDKEIDGVDYHFVTKDEMISKIDRGEMLEVTEFNDWFYGTDIVSLDEDKINIGVYNPEGIEYLTESNDIELLVLYVYADDKVRLLRSLNREKKPDVKEIVRRYSTDEKDFEYYDDLLLHPNSNMPIIYNNGDISLNAVVKNTYDIIKKFDFF